MPHDPRVLGLMACASIPGIRIFNYVSECGYVDVSVDANQGQKRALGSLELMLLAALPIPPTPSPPPMDTRTELCQQALLN